MDRHAEEAARFIDESSDQPFFLMLSHYAVHAPLQGKPDKVKRYEQIPRARRQGKPHYAAMVESVDESVGRVMKALQDSSIESNTIVIFTSDNGGFAKATDNSPLRANKGSNYEGGLRVPFIIKWPGHAKPGSESNEPVISMDIYPTILAATGQNQRPHQHIDGENLVPLLQGNHRLDREALFWHYPHYNQHPQSFPSGVIRSRDWKLIESFETGDRYLYNLRDDVGETNDLSSEEPDRVAQLHTQLKRWRIDVDAESMRPNPEFVGNE
ncbi:MAG: sulfatase-like hydrolase/transferase [Planctomycetota bacterium]